MDVLDVVLLAVAYTAVIAGIAVATPRIGNFVASLLARRRREQATPAE